MMELNLDTLNTFTGSLVNMIRHRFYTLYFKKTVVGKRHKTVYKEEYWQGAFSLKSLRKLAKKHYPKWTLDKIRSRET